MLSQQNERDDGQNFLLLRGPRGGKHPEDSDGFVRCWLRDDLLHPLLRHPLHDQISRHPGKASGRDRVSGGVSECNAGGQTSDAVHGGRHPRDPETLLPHLYRPPRHHGGRRLPRLQHPGRHLGLRQRLLDHERPKPLGGAGTIQTGEVPGPRDWAVQEAGEMHSLPGGEAILPGSAAGSPPNISLSHRAPPELHILHPPSPPQHGQHPAHRGLHAPVPGVPGHHEGENLIWKEKISVAQNTNQTRHQAASPHCI